MKPKYWIYDDEKKLYIIRKSKNGTTRHFGSFKTQKEAELAIKIFKKTGWQEKDKWAVKAEVKEILEVNQ